MGNKPNNLTPTIDVSTILLRALECYQGVMQWRGGEDGMNVIANVGWLQNAANHASELQALVELVEIHLCGSTGGFAEGQERDGSMSIQARLRFLFKAFEVEWPEDEDEVEEPWNRETIFANLKENYGSAVKRFTPLTSLDKIMGATGYDLEEIHKWTENEFEVVIPWRIFKKNNTIDDIIDDIMAEVEAAADNGDS